MSSGCGPTSGSEGGGLNDEDGEVFGKVARVSILQQLQRFSKTPRPGPSSLLTDKLPKIQHLKSAAETVNPTTSSCISGTRSKSDAQLMVEETNVSNLSSECLVEDASPATNVNDISVKETKTLNNSQLCSSTFEPDNYLELDPGQVDSLYPSSPSATVNSGNTSVAYRKNVIRPINRDVVHQICSGQVIVTLSTAVKELIENSIDAGAKKVDIRLIEFGSKLIEVSDDASGIEETNFEGLALKHHTSKISEFEDLGNLSTFGFRGEALSSLCALANLTVITRHRDSDQRSGYKIEYDYRGNITSKVRCAREVGTTVVLKDLFHTLPVRHKEFAKNLKKEFHRMVNVLYGYCLIVDGVKITCTNQVGNGGPQKVIAAPAYNSMRERIVTLFGSKQLASLVQINQPEKITEDILSEFGLSENNFEKKYELEGYISKPNHGRSSNDRQFYFINSRPCDPAKISRVINEVYHTFSRQQNPFVCLHVKTNKENVDVNVTPDKRTVYVQNEKILLATVKASLVPVLTKAASSFNPINTLSSQSQPSLPFMNDSLRQEKVENMSELCLSSSFEIECDSLHRKRKENYVDVSGGDFDPQYSTSITKLPRSVTVRSDSFMKSLSKGHCTTKTSAHYSRASFGSTFKRARDNESFQTQDEVKQPKLAGYLRKFEVGEKMGIGEIKGTYTPDTNEMEVQEIDPECETRNIESSKEESNHIYVNADDTEVVINDLDEEVWYDDEIPDSQNLLEKRSVSVSVEWISTSFKHAAIAFRRNGLSSSVTSYARKFRAKITPEDNSVAEDELRKQLTKDMFQKMAIVGQFNLGFIIVKNGPDLFIVDQHASDEKYNYEDLERSTVLNGQVLIRPLELDLPAVSENIIIDNVEIFQKNGFDFIITPDDEPRKRVLMSKIPFSKNIEFGKSDVEELIFMLEDAASGKCFYRPTKVRDMFASRACRKSVMIGTSLNKKEMRLIVDHMGEMDQPWNCPHGRPTIRHLINLNILPDLDLTKFNH